MTRDPQLYFPSKGSHTQDFYSLKNPLTPAGIEPMNLVSRGEYDNNWTSGVDVSQNDYTSTVIRGEGRLGFPDL